ncbi:hypothetical protein PN462_00055 [Spirulina sp. CS-785/01]|uniref:hypothetical protein n=1 Tax=Spirulina sp. CS-785/01 TaxID=3021716 RepID=UPI00232D28C2|nr:hypothetical protein [Spirulina sp. CS-785/01]MDB9311473.1 hypothetical protein [Spirulina sp. CS-785/01]
MANKQQSANYDRKLVAAETAARQEREQEFYKDRPDNQGDMDTSSGYTVDREGLANNFPIEPEMYINEPGDLNYQDIEETAERKQELQEINQTNEEGKLEMGDDERGKGPGMI